MNNKQLTGIISNSIERSNEGLGFKFRLSNFFKEFGKPRNWIMIVIVFVGIITLINRYLISLSFDNISVLTTFIVLLALYSVSISQQLDKNYSNIADNHIEVQKYIDRLETNLTDKLSMIDNHFRERINITIMEKIQDDEFQKIGQDLIEHCEQQLQELARGTYNEGGLKVFSRAIERIKESKTVKATHLANSESLAYSWWDEIEKRNYYAANKIAIKNGAKIFRVFILKKELLTDKKMKEILNEHFKDGIDVTVVLENDIPTELRDCLKENFAIFDNSVVQIQKINKIETDDGARISKNPETIKLYNERFGNLKNYGTNWNEIKV